MDLLFKNTWICFEKNKSVTQKTKHNFWRKRKAKPHWEKFILLKAVADRKSSWKTRARVGAQSGLGPGPGWGPYGPIGPLWAHKGPILGKKLIILIKIIELLIKI